MPMHFPPKKRSVAVGKTFPARSRSVGVGENAPKGPSPRKATTDGNKPAKGVLTTGGGHG